MKLASSFVLSIALLLIPVNIWLEHTYPEIWQQRLFAPFAEPEQVVNCVDNILILGTSDTGYTILENCS